MPGFCVSFKGREETFGSLTVLSSCFPVYLYFFIFLSVPLENTIHTINISYVFLTQHLLLFCCSIQDSAIFGILSVCEVLTLTHLVSPFRLLFLQCTVNCFILSSSLPSPLFLISYAFYHKVCLTLSVSAS